MGNKNQKLVNQKLLNKKVVVKTVQTIVRTYFVEVPNPEWSCDAIVMNDLEEYSYRHLSEDILSTEVVQDWPELGDDESVNAAVTKYDEDTNDWTPGVLWPGDREVVYKAN